MAWTDITPEDCIRIDQETEMFLYPEREDYESEYEKNGFRDAQNFWDWKEG